MSSGMQEPDVPLWVSDAAQGFLSKCLAKDPAKRSKAEDLLKHPWLKTLGMKPPAEQTPSSIAMVTPVLQPRPVVPEPAAVKSSQDAVAEEQADVENEVPLPPVVPSIEIAVSASGT